MKDVSPDRVRLSVAEARDLAERALRGGGYDSIEARILADHMLDAALCGYEYSGLPKILNTLEHPKAREPRTPMRPIHETDVSVLFDGGNAVGMLTMYRATRAAIEKATPRQPGVEEIRIPSERSFRERARRMREGISIERRVFDALQGWANR